VANRHQPQERGDQERVPEPGSSASAAALSAGVSSRPDTSRRHGADQHGPEAADEGAEERPPERGAHTHIRGQVARVVRDVDRPGELIGGRGEQLGQERDRREVAQIQLAGGKWARPTTAVITRSPAIST